MVHTSISIKASLGNVWLSDLSYSLRLQSKKKDLHKDFIIKNVNCNSANGSLSARPAAVKDHVHQLHQLGMLAE